LSSLRVMAHV